MLKKLFTFYLIIFSFIFCQNSFGSQNIENSSNNNIISVKNSSQIAKSKILFSGFEANEPELDHQIQKIFNKIKSNLNSTNLFHILQFSQNNHNEDNNISSQLQNAALNSSLLIDSMPIFTNLQPFNLDFLVIFEANFDENNNIEIKIRIWDAIEQKQVLGKFYSSNPNNYKKIANIISNEIYKAATGEAKGHFDSKILYVSETGPANKRIKKINLIDFDAENRITLTNGHDLVLTPTFSRSTDDIFYLRYVDYRPQIFRLNIGSLENKKVGSFKGTTFSPYPHPQNDNLVLLSIILNGNTDIYELNVEQNIARRLTKNPAIDTTPSYSPDGKTIAFSSDRDGGQQIYLSDVNGTNVRRISFGKGSYSKPIWSPDGKTIAFTKIKNDQFFICTMSANGGNEKTLASGYLVEGAKWSPNGRYIIYSKKKAKFGIESIPKLYFVDVLTGFETKINTPELEGATDPDWK
jgi:TolB protein